MLGLGFVIDMLFRDRFFLALTSLLLNRVFLLTLPSIINVIIGFSVGYSPQDWLGSFFIGVLITFFLVLIVYIILDDLFEDCHTLLNKHFNKNFGFDKINKL